MNFSISNLFKWSSVFVVEFLPLLSGYCSFFLSFSSVNLILALTSLYYHKSGKKIENFSHKGNKCSTHAQIIRDISRINGIKNNK